MPFFPYISFSLSLYFLVEKSNEFAPSHLDKLSCYTLASNFVETLSNGNTDMLVLKGFFFSPLSS